MFSIVFRCFLTFAVIALVSIASVGLVEDVLCWKSPKKDRFVFLLYRTAGVGFFGLVLCAIGLIWAV